MKFVPKVLISLHPRQYMDGSIDLDFECMSDEDDVGENSQSLEFLKDIIVTPQAVPEKSKEDDEVVDHVKRNLPKSFDGVVKRCGSKQLKQVKIERIEYGSVK